MTVRGINEILSGFFTIPSTNPDKNSKTVPILDFLCIFLADRCRKWLSSLFTRTIVLSFRRINNRFAALKVPNTIEVFYTIPSTILIKIPRKFQFSTFCVFFSLTDAGKGCRISPHVPLFSPSGGSTTVSQRKSAKHNRSVRPPDG
ncbi:hypothetical protein JTE90_005101 [Oedothorax gibbosus]|uniref:Uncharacterized protein n=1 Tax=Oedothorax gibbosus TaxID=931172 RepID=A0AAV6V9X2_9ARAC|nr:hypothetical protein JTE90_005101 [Oedothorax gibbosus]